MSDPAAAEAPLTQGSLCFKRFSCLKTKFPQTVFLVGGNSFYRNIVSEKASALFLLPIAGTKEKAKQKENAVMGNFALCGGRPRLRALDVRRLLKKAGENFQKGVGWSPSYLPDDISSG